jgi:hypothetical protein
MEDLQKSWDRFLVQSFYSFPNDNTFHAVHVFMLKNNVSLEELKQLKRVPRTIHHNKVTVSRFVCAFLPTIAKVLWEHNVNDLDRLAEAVSKLKSDAREYPVDQYKYREETKEIGKDKRTSKITYMKKQAMDNLYAKYRRSNQWGVTK